MENKSIIPNPLGSDSDRDDINQDLFCLLDSTCLNSSVETQIEALDFLLETRSKGIYKRELRIMDWDIR